MENMGLIFIPDISGFSRFVSEMEIEHSRLIIKELLEILIDANQTGLEISEIEGDAILFYRFGERPSLGEVYSQVREMFREFHKSLLAYENRRFCQCTACLSAIGLTLKVVTHFGEFAEYRVKNFNKLIGRDIIVAHRLLKNDIENHEYWLVTDNLAKEGPLPDLAGLLQWAESSKQTEEGAIIFHYAPLGHLKNELSPDMIKKPDLDNLVRALTFTRVYETDIIPLLHATADFTYRPRWMEGVREVLVENHFLPRVGMKCRVLSDNGESTIISGYYSYGQDRIEFSETDTGSDTLWYYFLERLGDRKTKLTLHYYIRRDLLPRLLFNMGKKNKTERSITRSLHNLDGFVSQLKVPTTLS